MEQKQQTTAEQVISKIDKDCVKPIARWHFVMKNNSFWALWALSVTVGSCAMAATVFVFLNSGWQYHSITHDNLFKFFFDVLPLFWLVSFGLMILFGYYNVRHTNRGYRFSFYLVVVSSVVASLIGGTILYTLGIAGDIDDLRKPLPFSSPIIFIEEGRWNDTSRGLISGVVKSFDEKKDELILDSFSGEEKILSTRELEMLDISRLSVGSHIRIIGGFDIDNPSLFIACAVLPWEIQGMPYTPPQIHLPENKQFERKLDDKRINRCKDVRPYQVYKQILITN
jgi:hypothetical protein